MIRAIIFDLDGLLIDSEPHWQEAERAALAEVDVTLTDGMLRQGTGLRVDEEVALWYEQAPWDAQHSQADVVERIVQRVRAAIEEQGAPLPGALTAVDACAGLGVPLAIASSSRTEIIEAALARLGLADRFDLIRSAEHEPYGKPHPGVYLSAAERLGSAPGTCVAFEDSLNGVLAAKAARMRCIAVPEPERRDDPRFSIADIVLPSLEAFSPSMLEQL